MDVSVGKEVDGYQVLGVLGQGGMGVVYLAEDVALARKVALKVIDPALARDESFLRRFRAEARALARIDSPHIVSVHALRQTDFGLFIVMEYVEGGTVADPISEGPMAWPRAIPLIKQMLQAFAHAHGVGVIHRDIKPSNIMLTPEGMVKVTDFGLAKLHQQNSEVTVTQGISGTLFYMSPEQVKGHRDLDHRSDLYSLGMTIYEMLAGRIPMERNEGQFAVLKRIVEETPPPPSRYAPDLPDALVRIVMKALAKDPAERYQTAEEMLADVVAFERRTADAGGDGAASSGTKPDSSGRRSLLIGSAVALFVLLGVAGILISQTWLSNDSSALLTVTTLPEGVMVYVGNSYVGETPIRDQAVGEGRLSMRLVKDGFVPIDTTVVSENGRPLALDVRMARLGDVQTAVGTITSNPSDAEVWIDGTLVGRTPYALEDMEPGMLTIQLRKDGFQDLELREELNPGEGNAIAATLQPITRTTSENTPPTPPRPASGTLTVRADTRGYIEVDGRPVRAAEPITLPGGPHTVACGEAPYRTETNVRVAPDQSTEVSCYFTTSVNVVTTLSDGSSTWASIWVDGKNQGLAPMELKLEPGTYGVSVQREGFTVLDDEKTLTLKPGLQPQTVHLAFRISR